MENLERIGEALRLVERYEDYLFRRALGISFIVNGLIFPTLVLIAFKGESISAFFNVSPDVFVPLASWTILIGGMAVIMVVFTSAHAVSSRLRKTSLWANSPHLVALFSLWFLSFYLTRYAPEHYKAVSWLWAGGFASLVTYAFNRVTVKDWSYPELLIVGAVLLVSSIPVMGLGDAETMILAAVAVLAVSFFVAGIYSFSVAANILKESDR